jgi:hypothetical protein
LKCGLYRLIVWNVLDRTGIAVKDHVVWEAVDFLVFVIGDVSIAPPNAETSVVNLQMGFASRRKYQTRFALTD